MAEITECDKKKKTTFLQFIISPLLVSRAYSYSSIQWIKMDVLAFTYLLPW